jgi:predicted CoA-binding protein
MGKKTLVLGASGHSYRYSFMAINRLVAAGHEVVALGGTKGKVGNISIVEEPGDWVPVDTVTIYLNPYNQQQYYNYLLGLKPKRVIFNPGAENDELRNLLSKAGVETDYACTLVLLSTGQY